MAGEKHHVAVLNPIGAALAHFTAATRQHLVDSGVDVSVWSVDEPSASGQGRVDWVRSWASLIRKVNSTTPPRAHLLIVWPALGYWDAALVRILAPKRQTSLIIHDPEPLVAAVGYGKVAHRSVGLARTALIVHGSAAATVVRRNLGRGVRLHEVPHPMLTPQQVAPSERRTVLVLGQYKPDRDIAALRRIASDRDPDWDLQIVGRGWPEVPGWTVTSRFLAEAEFAAAIRESSVVVIPYRKFFQSGVAYRALEAGKPVVGPRSSSLAEMLGPSSPWLADDDWSTPIRAALDDAPSVALDVAQSLHARTQEGWSRWARYSAR